MDRRFKRLLNSRQRAPCSTCIRAARPPRRALHVKLSGRLPRRGEGGERERERVQRVERVEREREYREQREIQPLALNEREGLPRGAVEEATGARRGDLALAKSACSLFVPR